jgi:hypothetical protein
VEPAEVLVVADQVLVAVEVVEAFPGKTQLP